MGRRIVVTGVSVISPLGSDKQVFWEGLIQGTTGIRHITHFDASAFSSQIAGEVDDSVLTIHLSPRELRRNSRYLSLALAGSSLAVRDASLGPEQLAGPRTGVVVGTAIGPVAAIEEQVVVSREAGIGRVSPFLSFMGIAHSAASAICINLSIPGPARTMATGCIGGIDAVGYALDEIRRGTIDIAIAGAAEAPICPVALASLCNTGMLSIANGSPATASRPFDRRHNGFVLSEGAAFVILECLDRARDRGAHIYGEVLGYGSSSDAYHLFDVDPTGAGFVGAMQSALKDAGIEPRQIDYINAHAPSIETTDRAEAKAIGQVLQQRGHGVPVSSIKGHLGQAFAASNVQQIITSLFALQNQMVPPTANFEEQDPECEVDCSAAPRPHHIETALINAHTLGGSNSSLVIGKVAP